MSRWYFCYKPDDDSGILSKAFANYKEIEIYIGCWAKLLLLYVPVTPKEVYTDAGFIEH